MGNRCAGRWGAQQLQWRERMEIHCSPQALSPCITWGTFYSANSHKWLPEATLWVTQGHTGLVQNKNKITHLLAHHQHEEPDGKVKWWDTRRRPGGRTEKAGSLLQLVSSACREVPAGHEGPHGVPSPATSTLLIQHLRSLHPSCSIWVGRALLPELGFAPTESMWEEFGSLWVFVWRVP